MKNVHLASLGCARNLVDSEEMLGRLAAEGWRVVNEPDRAHLIIVNTCSFIESAAEESIETILELASFKEEGRCHRLIVAGCLPERYREELAKEMPEVDVFLGTGAFDRIIEAARGQMAAGSCMFPDPDTLVQAKTPRVRTHSHSVYLKIAEGCSRKCTYCIIPRLRGRQKSRPSALIMEEAREFIASGAREIVLVAQDTTAYGQDRQGETDLAGLLAGLSELSDDIWLRVLYGHPESIDTRIIRTIAERSNICSYYDLPVQHAGDAVLKKMGRHHTKADLHRLFEEIRRLDPAASLRTTLITGFPGETDADFEELYDFIQDVRFDHLGVFTYSDAEDLPSHRLPNPVPPEIAEQRRERLMNRQMEISEEKMGEYLDQPLDVLIEALPEPHIAEGRTAFQAPEVDGMVFVRHSGVMKIGDRVPVRITDSLEYDLVGEA